MPCFHPLKGYRSRSVNPSTGKRSIVFSKKHGFTDMEVSLPCGQCIGCRLERSRQWAIRCVHEASLYEDNCFITLTYNDRHLPSSDPCARPGEVARLGDTGTLDLRDFQLFMKKLRKYFEPRTFRFFHCGEYGERFARPHYHACLFNVDFPDRELVQEREDGNYYSSKILEEIWGKGYCIVGDVTFESAAYVARYITKKITGQESFSHYNDVDFTTGQVVSERRPEYVTMSRRPGVGKGWFEKYGKNTMDNDRVVINGKVCKPPKYYDSQFELIDASQLARLKAERKVRAKKHDKDNTLERRLEREECQYLKFNQLKRSYESE